MGADTPDPKRRCHDLVGLLADYVEHHLPPEVHAELEKHLSRCPRCVAQLKTYQSTVSLLRSITEEELPAELRCTLHAFLHRGCKN
jgi:anti-sigma factor RsiW